ncbi:ParB N-terminal domain-containing protein [Streptomyces sp. NPDC004629]|uniref:ParB N-terminal domain-containing protein n=1 Tax=Streptomyces sp. NPDC004629 TaxID=3364705 RepID=UPI0036AB00E4
MNGPSDPGVLLTVHEEVVRLPVAQLVTGGSPRASGEDEEHVRALAVTEDELPPIIVHRATMRVIDGAHRLRAARLRDQEYIRAHFFDGSGEDAFVLAVRANVGHGLPLSLKDRVTAAERIVTTHSQWSDRMIASAAGISARTVAEIRRRTTGVEPAGVRIGKDGRARPVDGARRRTLAHALLTENPDLSLRQVARAAGISPETVRAVRNRLLYGRPQAPAPAPSPARPQPRQSGVVQEAILRRLTADPALRQTESGRALLRILHAQAMAAEEWQTILDQVPTHCAALVGEAARESARMWEELADRISEKAPGE